MQCVAVPGFSGILLQAAQHHDVLKQRSLVVSLPPCNCVLMHPRHPAGEARVTMRRALLRYRGKFLLSARQLLPHPEGPAVWLLPSTSALPEVIASLLREPVSRQSRGHIAVQVRCDCHVQAACACLCWPCGSLLRAFSPLGRTRRCMG